MPPEPLSPEEVAAIDATFPPADPRCHACDGPEGKRRHAAHACPSRPVQMIGDGAVQAIKAIRRLLATVEARDEEIARLRSRLAIAEANGN